MPELKIHRLTDYFLANTETWLTYQNTNTADWVFSKIGLRKYDWTQGARFGLFFRHSRRRDVVGCSWMADTLLLLYHKTIFAYLLCCITWQKG